MQRQRVDLEEAHPVQVDGLREGRARDVEEACERRDEGWLAAQQARQQVYAMRIENGQLKERPNVESRFFSCFIETNAV